MNRKYYFLVCKITLIVIFCLLCFNLKAHPTERIKWKLQTPFPIKSAQTAILCQSLVNEVKKRSADQFIIEIFPPGALLGGGADLLEGTSKGVVEVSLCAPGYLSGIIPFSDLEFYGLPFTKAKVPDIYYFWTTYKDQMALKLTRKEYQKYGVINLLGAVYLNVIGTKFRFEKIEDLKGKKIYVHGLIGKILQKLDASPITLSSAELYTALQRGTVDGYIHAEYVIETYKLKEVVNYLIIHPIISSGLTYFLINEKAFNKLPESYQKILIDSSNFAAKIYAEDYEKVVNDSLQKAKDYGIKFLKLDEQEVKKLRNIAMPLWEEVAMKSEIGKILIKLYYEYYKSIGAI